ncbi:dihydrouridine synthase, DuS (plasmid) [Kalymmatonema gypsitolerans NIES-4073]|nr:dihydrouridine synthase, DuS [Scytonema sp. NIES-4073]
MFILLQSNLHTTEVCFCKDYFFTEYFRVNDTSPLNRSILATITENYLYPTNRCLIAAQFIVNKLQFFERVFCFKPLTRKALTIIVAL